MSKYHEPWEIIPGANPLVGDNLMDANGMMVGNLRNDHYGRYADRTKAAVEAVAGLSEESLAKGIVGLAVELATCQEWDDNGYCWYCGRQTYAGQGEHTEDCKPAKVRALLDVAAAAGGD